MEVQHRIERKRNKNWPFKKLEEIALIVDGTHQTPNYTDSGVRFVSVENIGCIRDTDKFISLEDYEKFKVKPQKNDILMTRITAGVIGKTEIVQSNEPLGYYVSLALIRCNEDLNVEYINEAMGTIFFRRELNKRIIHTAFPKKINLRDIGKCQVILPDVEVQQKIVLLARIEKKVISLLEELIINKRKLRKWIQQILLDTNNYSGHRMWHKVSLNEIIKEIDTRTTENNEYPILSVTKTGIYLQSEQFNKQIASEDNRGYKIIRKGNLVFSTMNLWMGSLDVLDKYNVGIISPAYKVFEFEETKIIPEFGKYFMKSSYMMWLYNINSEQGASIVRKNLDLDALLKTRVQIPNINEQKKIVQVLKSVDKELELLQRKIDLIRAKKIAVTHQLLEDVVSKRER